jgi:NTE family protein
MMQNASMNGNPARDTRSPTVALALGGGGARGIAHILMFEVFDELGIKPCLIAGTSIGALYGAAYASGLSAAQIRAYTDETLGRRFDLVRQLFAARSEPVQKLLKLVPLRTSLLNPATLLDLVFPGQVAKDFESLKIPLKVVATDLECHDSLILSSGPLRSAVAASMAIPVVFSPVVLDDHLLADGGLTNPLPYDLIQGTADITVAIDVTGATSEADLGPRPTAVEIMVQSIQILQKSITRERLRHQRPDILIEVDVDRFGALEFYKPREILEAAGPAKALLKRKLTALLSSHRAEPGDRPDVEAASVQSETP